MWNEVIELKKLFQKIHFIYFIFIFDLNLKAEKPYINFFCDACMCEYICTHVCVHLQGIGQLQI